MTTTLYNALIERFICTSVNLTTFLRLQDEMKPAFALVPVEFSNFLVNAIDLSADLTAATQALLNASILGDIPFECLPSSAAYYVRHVGCILSFHTLFSCAPDMNGIDSENYDAAVKKILVPGTWVRPFFLGIEGLVKQSKEGNSSLEDTEASLGLGPFFLKMDNSSDSAVILASPAFQADARRYLIGYSTFVTSVLAPLENDSLHDRSKVSARNLDMLAYGAMAEATVRTAQANAVVPNWTQLASNIIDLVNAWMRFNAMKCTKKAAIAYKIANWLVDIASGLQDQYAMIHQGPNSFNFYDFCVPIDVAVQLTTAVERLVALAGSCANFYTPIPPDAPTFHKVTYPCQPAMRIAALLSNICSRSVKLLDPADCGSMWKKAMEASLLSLETTTTTVSLLFNGLTLKERHLLVGDEHMSPLRDVSMFNEDISQVLSNEMWILSILTEVAPPSNLGQEPLFIVSGFLTMAQACAILKPTIQGPWLVSIQFLPNLLAWAREILLDCLLTSDIEGIAYLCSAAELAPGGYDMSKEDQKKSLAALKNILETEIPNIDDTDPARLKLRAQVLGLRGCANIKCTTLRPSSKKSFSKLCAGCQSVRYCGAQCQKADWKGNHKGACKQFQEEAQEAAA